MALRDPRAASALHLHPRNPDPTGSRSHGDPTDLMGDLPHRLAKEQLIPQIANRTRNAIDVDRREVFFYQKLRSGRRCSCWASGETQPSSGCQICYQTGFAGGYHKWGTETYQFDPSRQWWGVNVLLNPLLGVPPWFSLEENTTSGYVEWDQDLTRTEYFGIDSSFFDYRNSDGRVKFLIRLDGVDTMWLPFTEEGLKSRIIIAKGRRLRFRVELTRVSPRDKSPYFQQFWFRALVNSPEPPVLFVDIPRRNESNVLAEFGLTETYNSIQFAFSDTIQRINLDDLIVRLFDMTRWKVNEASPNDPQNILTSHDVQARKVTQNEIIWGLPL